MIRNATYENLHTALVGHFRLQLDQAGSKTFKISEVATGYASQINHGNRRLIWFRLTFMNRRIIGWTSLLWPNPQTTEQKEQEGQKTAPPEGIDLYLANHFFGSMLPASKEFGFNPKEHFRMW